MNFTYNIKELNSKITTFKKDLPNYQPWLKIMWGIHMTKQYDSFNFHLPRVEENFLTLYIYKLSRKEIKLVLKYRVKTIF